MILVVDIGNTSVSFGLFREDRIVRRGRLDGERASPKQIRTALLSVVKTARVRGACLASVAPSRTPRWRRVVESLTEGPVLEVSPELDLGLPVTYRDPATIGADRLANAAGGAVRYGLPLIVADFGTAVTFDLVTRRDGYIGGIIAPGLPLMFDYLAEKTEKLPHLQPRPQHGAFGHTTMEAMQLGAQWGYRGMVREILANLRQQPSLRRAMVVATGGYADWVVEGLRPAMTVDPDLTLFGLGCIYRRNGG